MNQIQHKRGATFDHTLEVPEKVAQSFTEWRVEAQLRKEGNLMPSGLIANLSSFITKEGDKVLAKLYHKDTSYWPICTAEFDIRFTSDSEEVIISPSVTVSVINAVTA